MRHFLLLLLSLCFINCYQVERDCTEFKTGTFEFSYTVDGIEKTGKFVRTDRYNIDYFDNKIDSASVRWINDCEFIQKELHPKNKDGQKAIHFKIISTTDDSYSFEYKLAAKDPYKKERVEKGTAKKID
ncbi:MAG: hypothetical protein WA775_12460 [Psychroserpens sp.]|uniref:hypothetical protein n=1 Tax=Psychroserpens sp. TaxID=2020870 RepID=UPI003C86D39A